MSKSIPAIVEAGSPLTIKWSIVPGLHVIPTAVVPFSPVPLSCAVTVTGPSAIVFVIVTVATPALNAAAPDPINPVPSPLSVTFVPPHCIFDPTVTVPPTVKFILFAGA